MKNKIILDEKCILITGVAGFIGYCLAIRLLEVLKSATLIGIDSMTDYNPVPLKEYRLGLVDNTAKSCSSTWRFFKVDIADEKAIGHIFDEYHPNIVVNLAAQAGVRYSAINPKSYINSNLEGFFNILECCRREQSLEHVIYASSSSVYGGRTDVPFRETDCTDNPVSLYAATKKSNELLAHSYSKLYDVPITGLRFFTVYGPAGRTDMAYFSFTEKLRRGEKVELFNYGNCQRDFTYVDDIVSSIVTVMKNAPEKVVGEDGLPIPPHDIYNIGNSHPENLMDFVKILAQELINVGVLADNFDIEKHVELVPMQPGDVPITYADTSKLERDFGYKPTTDLRSGLSKFAKWYRDYYGKRTK